MILVTGASGLVGGPAIPKLLAGGQRLRAFTSSQASAEKLKAAGVSETEIGDFRNDADVARAMRGVGTVVHIPPTVVEDEHEIGYRVVAAAQRAGVDHFVFVSCYHPHPSDIRNHHNKLLVEDALYKSELNFTVLQPSMFMQNLGFIWSTIASTGVMAWPWSPTQKFAMLDTGDLGEAIAKVVADPRFRGGTYELSSDDTVTVTEMAAILSTAWGKRIRVGQLDPTNWGAGMRKNGAPEWTVQAVMGMARCYDAFGYRGGNSVVYQAITGRKPTTYSEFAARWVRDKTH